MRKYDETELSGEEFFLGASRTQEAKPSPALENAPQSKGTPQGGEVPAPAYRARGFMPKNAAFVASVDSFSSLQVGKPPRKKKRKLGVDGFLRLIAICVCIGIFTYSLLQITDRLADLADADEAYEKLGSAQDDQLLPRPRHVRRVPKSESLLDFLGSDSGGIELLDTETQNYYEELRDQVLMIRETYPDCVGYITVSDTKINYPIMKAKNNSYYLRRLYNGEYSRAGSIFADCRMKDDYDANMNYVVYGHCMTNGSMFRAIKLFFDSEYRYSIAQDMKITVVTVEGVYIYDYFSGYRSEGNFFTKSYTDNGQNALYYNFLKNIRARNTVYKNTGYNANSKIITLVTCTNLASLPDERYVLHGILADHFTFE